MDIPKRRKSMDNPYTLIIFDNRYYVEFRDGRNILNKVEVTKELFNTVFVK